MKKLLIIVMLLVISGCATVRYNGADTFVSAVDHPPIGKVITVHVGDYMVEKGNITKENVLIVHNTIDGLFYDIPAGQYRQIGFDENQDFYSAHGVIRAALADPFEALMVKKQEDTELCVITVFTASMCNQGKFERKTRLSEKGNSFQQTLIYSGRIGDRINIGYREFSNNTARPSFNNEVEYDLTTSNIIGYKGALIEIIKADNSSITYKVIRNFR